MRQQKKLRLFIAAAKRNAYASAGEGGERALADGGKEFMFKRGDYTYRDIYYGSNPFIGEEIVWFKNKAVWGMNYCGRVVSKAVLVKEVYSFLKSALKKVTADNPFRGPEKYKCGNFSYVNKFEGTINGFHGFERILHKEKIVYGLEYQGGDIKG